MKNKRIIISDIEKDSILKMHESYKKNGIILEDEKPSNNFSNYPCVLARNKRISSGYGYRSGEYIIIDNKQYYPDGIVAYDRERQVKYHCENNNIIEDEPIEQIPKDCISDKSQKAQKSFYALDKACENYLLSKGYEGWLANFNFTGIIGIWKDVDIRKAILILDNKQDLNDLKEIINCITEGEVTLDDILSKGMYSWSADYKKTYQWIKNLK